MREDAQGDVYVAKLRRSGRLDARRFTLYDGDDFLTDFARDGALLFWSDRQGRPGSLFLQRLEEDVPTVLVPDLQSAARVTPDGKGLIWFRPLDLERGRWELVSVDEPIKFKSPRVVTETQQSPLVVTPVVQCARVPSGSCVIADAAGDTRVFVEIDPKEGRVREIARIRVHSGGFDSWALDGPGERIVVAEDRRAPYILSVSDGTLTPLADLRPPCKWPRPAWAPDGKSLLLGCKITRDDSCGLTRYHLDGRTETLWESRSCLVGDLHFSPDGRHIAFGVLPLDADIWMVELVK